MSKLKIKTFIVATTYLLHPTSKKSHKTVYSKPISKAWYSLRWFSRNTHSVHLYGHLLYLISARTDEKCNTRQLKSHLHLSVWLPLQWLTWQLFNEYLYINYTKFHPNLSRNMDSTYGISLTSERTYDCHRVELHDTRLPHSSEFLWRTSWIWRTFHDEQTDGISK